MCEDYDYPTLFEAKKLITRKPRKCSGCHMRFDPKTPMTRWKGLWDNTFTTAYFCTTCTWLGDQADTSPFHACLTTHTDAENCHPDSPFYIEAKEALAAGREPNKEVALANDAKLYGARLH